MKTETKPTAVRLTGLISYFKIKTGKYNGKVVEGFYTSELNIKTVYGNYFNESDTIEDLGPEKAFKLAAEKMFGDKVKEEMTVKQAVAVYSYLTENVEKDEKATV